MQIREVTIDTMGNNSIRFYSIGSERATSMQDRLSNTRELLDRHTENSSRYPGKKYPEGAYSHNVEYQVSSVSTLDKIYDSVSTAWVRGKGCTLRVSQ